MIETCLTIHLRPDVPVLEVSILDRDVEPAQLFDGEYVWGGPLPQGSICPWFDWLRTADGTLVRVRMFPYDPDVECLLYAARATSYATVCEQSLELYFDGRKEYEPELSADQNVLGCTIWCTDWKVACSFPIDQEELDRVVGRSWGGRSGTAP